MKELRDLENLTIHDVQLIRDSGLRSFHRMSTGPSAIVFGPCVVQKALCGTHFVTRPSETLGNETLVLHLQGYLAHKKQRPSRTLP